MKKALFLFSMMLFALPALVWAHEGHGHTHGYTIIHYFVEPQHALVTIPTVILAFWFFGRRIDRRNPQSGRHA